MAPPPLRYAVQGFAPLRGVRPPPSRLARKGRTRLFHSVEKENGATASGTEVITASPVGGTP